MKYMINEKLYFCQEDVHAITVTKIMRNDKGTIFYSGEESEKENVPEELLHVTAENLIKERIAYWTKRLENLDLELAKPNLDLNQSIDCLEFPKGIYPTIRSRVLNQLKLKGIKTIDDLMNTKPATFQKMTNFGNVSISYLNHGLAKFGLNLNVKL